MCILLHQRASRAFAGELLPPRSSVVAQFETEHRPVGDNEVIQSVAEHYEVDTDVVQWQLVHAMLSGNGKLATSVSERLG